MISIVVAFVEDAGDGVEDVEGEVDADAEVGCKDNAYFFACGLDGGFACIVKTGRADDDVDVLFPRIFAGVSGLARDG